MQILKRFPDAIAANLARANLAQHGIDAFAADEMLANSDPRAVFASGGVRLMVADEEINEAADILQASSGIGLVEDISNSNSDGEAESEVSGPTRFGSFFRTCFRWIVLVGFAAWLVYFLGVLFSVFF